MEERGRKNEERRKEETYSMSIEYVGVAEVAEMAGVTNSAVCNWRRRYLTFPKPVQELALGPIYNKDDIKSWLLMYKNGADGLLLLHDTERRMRKELKLNAMSMSSDRK